MEEKRKQLNVLHLNEKMKKNMRRMALLRRFLYFIKKAAAIEI